MVNEYITKPEWDGWSDYSGGRIQMTEEQWIECLADPFIFHDSDILFFQRILEEPNEAFTCTEFAQRDSVHPSSYITPIVTLAKRITAAMKLPVMYRDGEMWCWPVVFLGKEEAEENHFSWKIRPELSKALAYLANGRIERKSKKEAERTKEKREIVDEIYLLESENSILRDKIRSLESSLKEICMHIPGNEVNHSSFGTGLVIGLRDSIISVKFDARTVRFEFPKAFNHYLTPLSTQFSTYIDAYNEKSDAMHSLCTQRMQIEEHIQRLSEDLGN